MADEKQDEGQVSEVSGLKADPDDRSSLNAPGQQISAGDSVAGQPEGESGKVDEGPTGPEAPTLAKEHDHYPDKDDVETTG
ncbi:hypothetical protein GON03_07165 [Nocardioides sp. MAH-18]|uniref:Uncharacterized protein n=1 Tax=Nocardioides agri TaxID=2682843 RepID=A0A6L6XPP4_9ACTN|nr:MULTISPECIES: hypothetical protein [unclassified Nocardioides]MBA2954095.1 hypothetical protein [Nocardioides sp. CGMCC 1.13656]MVQ48958.1 hypothetical protein [Nocardioides sp. MAH-18]